MYYGEAIKSLAKCNALDVEDEKKNGIPALLTNAIEGLVSASPKLPDDAVVQTDASDTGINDIVALFRPGKPPSSVILRAHPDPKQAYVFRALKRQPQGDAIPVNIGNDDTIAKLFAERLPQLRNVQSDYCFAAVKAILPNWPTEPIPPNLREDEGAALLRKVFDRLQRNNANPELTKSALGALGPPPNRGLEALKSACCIPTVYRGRDSSARPGSSRSNPGRG